MPIFFSEKSIGEKSDCLCANQAFWFKIDFFLIEFGIKRLWWPTLENCALLAWFMKNTSVIKNCILFLYVIVVTLSCLFFTLMNTIFHMHLEYFSNWLFIANLFASKAMKEEEMTIQVVLDSLLSYSQEATHKASYIHSDTLYIKESSSKHYTM